MYIFIYTYIYVYILYVCMCFKRLSIYIHSFASLLMAF